MIHSVSIPLSTSLETLYTRLHHHFRGTPFAILDSGWEPGAREGLPALSRRCIIAAEPFAILTARGASGHLQWVEGPDETGPPFELLRSMLERCALDEASPDTPFPAGALGYFGYELKSLVETVPSRLPADLDLPDLWLAFFDRAVTVDLPTQTLHLTSTGLPTSGALRPARASRRLDELTECVREATQKTTRSAPPSSSLPLRRPFPPFPSSNFTRDDYLQAVRRAQDYIAAGDIYQANLSQRFKTSFSGDAGALFLHLKQHNPAPFSAFIDAVDFQIVSASPERFLHFDAATHRIHTRPIKGTRPRGVTPEEDQALARQLLQSAKDRAEHLMIVDLERNDLGRVAKIGSVSVPEFIRLETFPTVFHLTSTVAATLRSDRDRVDLLRATFPGGSITGAPKIRAMEILEELETVRRGVYTGALGYLDFAGNMDLNIAIRTVTLGGGTACFHVGGGIVADSDPSAEYEETLVKGRALAEALHAVKRNSDG